MGQPLTTSNAKLTHFHVQACTTDNSLGPSLSKLISVTGSLTVLLCNGKRINNGLKLYTISRSPSLASTWQTVALSGWNHSAGIRFTCLARPWVLCPTTAPSSAPTPDLRLAAGRSPALLESVENWPPRCWAPLFLAPLKRLAYSGLKTKLTNQAFSASPGDRYYTLLANRKMVLKSHPPHFFPAIQRVSSNQSLSPKDLLLHKSWCDPSFTPWVLPALPSSKRPKNDLSRDAPDCIKYTHFCPETISLPPRNWPFLKNGFSAKLLSMLECKYPVIWITSLR